MNVILYNYARDNGYKIDLSNHSRGGLTASNALQYAIRNNDDKDNPYPIRESRFYGTATYVPEYAEYLLKNGYKYSEDGQIYDSSAFSAVHYTDFVGRTPLIGFRSKYLVGGNAPTGGIENAWFEYTHSSYLRELPDLILKDSLGRNMDENGVLTGNNINQNPYKKEFDEKWREGTTHNLNDANPSAPILVKPLNDKEWNNHEKSPH